MSLWTMIFLLGLAGMIFAAWKHKIDAQNGVIRDDYGKVQQINSGREEELKREVRELRERVKVLERIATEDRSSKQLSAEIEKLRDER